MKLILNFYNSQMSTNGGELDGSRTNVTSGHWKRVRATLRPLGQRGPNLPRAASHVAMEAVLNDANV